MKQVSGMKTRRSSDFFAHLHVDGLGQLTKQQVVADVIDSALLEPLEEYRLLHGITKLRLEDHDPEFLQSEQAVYS